MHLLARRLRALLLFLAPLACHAPSPSTLPVDEEWIVAVKSARLPDTEPRVSRFAHHTWLDLKRGSEERWLRVEVLNESSGVRMVPLDPRAARADRRWNERTVTLHDTLTGPDAAKVIEAVVEQAPRHHEHYLHGYRGWPGPNSNTFLAELTREVPGLAVLLHHNAVGKDYVRWFRAGATPSKTGVQVDTLPLGFALALKEGLQLHFLQLTLGVSLWPPRIELPCLPAIGF